MLQATLLTLAFVATAQVGKAPPSALAPFDAKQAKAHQIAWARYLRAKVEKVNSIGMNMVLIPPGEFMMGNTPEQLNVAKQMEKSSDRYVSASVPQHRVHITKPFLMGSTEVTVSHFKQFVEATQHVTLAEKVGFGNADKMVLEENERENKGLVWHKPGYPLTDASAVTQVTVEDQVLFCNWCSAQERLKPAYRQNAQKGWELVPGATGYRLPTEAEWEFACRAGTTTQFSFGDDPQQLEQYAWFTTNAKDNPSHTVGLKLPNPFGLYDIHGNVWERCEDFMDKKWYEQNESLNPTGPKTGTLYANRGGAWYQNYSYCPSAFRFASSLLHRYYNFGFRIVRSATTTSP